MFLWAEELNDTPRTTQGGTDKTFLLLPKQGIIYSTLQGSADDFSISIFLLGFLKHTETSALSNSSFPLFFLFFFFPRSPWIQFATAAIFRKHPGNTHFSKAASKWP